MTNASGPVFSIDIERHAYLGDDGGVGRVYVVDWCVRDEALGGPSVSTEVLVWRGVVWAADAPRCVQRDIATYLLPLAYAEECGECEGRGEVRIMRCDYECNACHGFGRDLSSGPVVALLAA